MIYPPRHPTPGGDGAGNGARRRGGRVPAEDRERERTSGDVEQALQEALALGEAGQWQEMVELLLRYLDDDEDPYLLCWLGVAERELGNDHMAYEYFRRCVAQQPTDPELLAVAGSGLAAFDDPEAEPTLRAAALMGPNLVSARLQYGAYLARSGMITEALEHLQAAAELAPEDPTVWSEMGVAHVLEGKLDSAAEDFEHTVDLAPDDSWTRLLLGLTYAELDRLEEAAEALIRAAEELEADVEAHALAALAAAAVGWEDAAHAALAQAEAMATGTDVHLVQEAEEKVLAGIEAAREALLEEFAPSILRERLVEPL